MKIWLDLAEIEPGHFVSIPLGDAKFVTEGREEGQAQILIRICNLNIRIYSTWIYIKF